MNLYISNYFNMTTSSTGLELARVPGTRGIFGQYCLAPADVGNFTTQHCVSPLKFENLLMIGTRSFKFPTQALVFINSNMSVVLDAI